MKICLIESSRCTRVRTPKCSSYGFALQQDAEKVALAMGAILAKGGVDTSLPRILCGRSIGATAAVHLAAHNPASPDDFSALMLEAGLITVKDLPMITPLSTMIPGAEMFLPMLPEPVATLQNIEQSHLPLLLIHGDRDEIVPYSQAQRALTVSGAGSKRLVTVSGAGHNDVFYIGEAEYSSALGQLVDSLAPITSAAVEAMSVQQLKAALTARGEYPIFEGGACASVFSRVTPRAT
eukprot:SAG11_NODE_2876_length_2880_cov_1.317512_2_plen_237_part_00